MEPKVIFISKKRTIGFYCALASLLLIIVSGALGMIDGGWGLRVFYSTWIGLAAYEIGNMVKGMKSVLVLTEQGITIVNCATKIVDDKKIKVGTAYIEWTNVHTIVGRMITTTSGEKYSDGDFLHILNTHKSILDTRKSMFGDEGRQEVAKYYNERKGANG